MKLRCAMTNKDTIKIMKIVMVLGFILFLFGHYLMSYSSLPETMGVTGLIISATCMAIGVIMSLPTKMYLTFIWVKGENERKLKEKAEQEKPNQPSEPIN